MKRWHTLALVIAGALLIAVGSAVAYVQHRWDRRYDAVAGPDLQASADSTVIARGRYLVHGPAHCSNCHVASAEDMVRADAGEAVPMQGGMRFDLGPVGVMAPSNLTPDGVTGIGRYSDRQLFRMLRHSIKPDGTASLWPMMPFSMMADDDLVAVVSYLRALPPVRHAVPAPHYTFMGKVLRVVMPAFRPQLGHAAPAAAPPQVATPERGAYLARYVANCRTCHTAHDRATLRFTGPEFAGGAEFPPTPGFPGYEEGLTFRSPNLTPHPSGVLGRFESREAWIARFRRGRVYAGSPMHWGPFSRMSDVDLEALWLFFNSLDPVANDVGATAWRAR